MVASGLRTSDMRQKPIISVNMCYASPNTALTIQFANRRQVTEMCRLRQIQPK